MLLFVLLSLLLVSAMKMIRLLLPVLSLLLIIQAQQTQPLYRLHSYKDFQGSDDYMWGMAQDARGLLLFAHNDGLKIYDGNSWSLLPSTGLLRAVAIDRDNRIYVGGKGDFGYMAPGDGYRLQYFSAKSKLPEAVRSHLNVTSIYTAPSTVYYVGTNAVAVGRWSDGALSITYRPMQSEIIGSGVANGVLYVQLAGKGLFKLGKDGKLAQVSTPDEFLSEDFAISRFAELPDKQGYLIVTAFYGIYRITPDQRIVKLNTGIEDLFSKYTVEAADVDANGNIAIGFRDEGMALLDANGRLVMRMEERNGFPNDQIFSCNFDNENGLWVGTSIGLVYTIPSLPARTFKGVPGISGKIHALAEHGGDLYVATNTGLYYTSATAPGQFERLGPAETESWDLLKADGRILAATSKGVYDVTGGKAQMLLDMYSNDLAAGRQQGLVYVATHKGLYTLNLNNNDTLRVGKLDEELNSVVEGADGIVWLGTTFRGLIRVEGANSSPKFSFLAGKDGLPDGYVRVQMAGGRLLVVTERSVLVEKGGKFEPEPTLNKLAAGGLVNISAEGNETVWLYSATGLHRLAVRGDKLVADSVAMAYMFNERPNVVYSAGNNTWLAFQDEVIRITGGNTLPEGKRKFAAIIRQVTTAEDSVLYQGYYWDDNGAISLKQTERFAYDLSYDFNSLIFHIGAGSYINPKSNQYQYILEGYDKEWSEWQVGPQAIRYPNLPEGKYTFRVRARNAFGEMGAEDSIEFSISPPWYRSLLAYLVYALMAGLLVWLLIRLNAARLKRQNKKLEALVDQRTDELRKEKEMVEQQNKIIEEKNEDITSSIIYAKRIQQAFMPEQDKFRSLFRDSMMLFKPRDIVSGDFYWWSEKNDRLVVAAVDCTGHGVPGAFMSIIGSTMLSQIVEQQGITNPVDILKQLDASVRSALGQDKPDSKTADGMDIAILVFDKARSSVQFAAAQRPLFLYRAGELNEIAGSKVFIGGKQYGEAQIEGHEIALQPGDRLYIFSDGLPDQFGGDNQRKFSAKRIREMLAETSGQKLESQKAMLENALKEWKGDVPQTDDIVFIGIEV